MKKFIQGEWVNCHGVCRSAVWKALCMLIDENWDMPTKFT